MAVQSVNYEYSIGDRVVIKAITLEGEVTGLSTDQFGNNFRVVYWAEQRRHVEWLHANEIMQWR